MSEPMLLSNLETKEDLVERLRKIIHQLSYFIKAAEEITKSKNLPPKVLEFIELLKDIRTMPDELGNAPLVIEETVKFVNGIVNEVHQVRIQIETSFSKEGTLKSAVEVLDKIPDSTLQATDQILNTLDNITNRENEIQEIINILIENTSQFDVDIQAKIQKMSELFTENQTDHFNIMDALQFQDITSQQIQHVNDLLEKTEAKLSELALKLKGLDEADIRKIIEASEKKDRIYDPNAEYKQRDKEQAMADELYEMKDQMSQNDVESLLMQFNK